MATVLISKTFGALPPGGILEYENGRLNVSTQSPLVFQPTVKRQNWRELAREWGDLLKTATVKRFQDRRRVVISLSAGLDSRAVVSSIPRSFRPLTARTRGGEVSYELKFARRIAQKLGIDHFAENPEDYLFSDGVKRIVWRTEGEATFLNGPTMFNHSVIKGHGDFLTGGYLGDAASGSHINPIMFFPESHDSFTDRMYQWYCSYSFETLALVFNTEFLNKYLPIVETEFKASYTHLRQSRNVDTYQLWDLYHRQTRMTMAAMPVDSHILQRISPFYDRDFVEFSASLPLNAKIGQALYKSMIYHIGPEIRDVPNSNNLKRLKPGVLTNDFDYVLDVANKIGSKIKNRIFPSNRMTKQKGQSEYGGELMRMDPEFRSYLSTFCESDYFDDSIFNRQGILKIINTHFDEGRDYTHILGLLGTFVSALPYFVYCKTVCCPADAQPYKA